MRKALDIMVLLFVLTTLAFGLIGCDGNADLAKPEKSEDVVQEPTSLDAFVIEGTILKELTDYGKTLVSIVLPDTITTIGEYAFEDCTGLTNVTIPDSVTKIGYRAFYGCTRLTDIYVNQTENTLFDNANVPDECEIYWNSTGSGSV